MMEDNAYKLLSVKVLYGSIMIEIGRKSSRILGESYESDSRYRKADTGFAPQGLISYLWSLSRVCDR